jgi:hypothetical protein
LRLYRRATPDGNPRQLTSEAPGNPYGLAQPRAFSAGGYRTAVRETEGAIEIREFRADDLEAIIEFSLRAWQPVFASVREVLGDDICAWCARIVIDGEWLLPPRAALTAIDARLTLSHSICPRCAQPASDSGQGQRPPR